MVFAMVTLESLQRIIAIGIISQTSLADPSEVPYRWIFVSAMKSLPVLVDFSICNSYKMNASRIGRGYVRKCGYNKMDVLHIMLVKFTNA